MFAPNLTVNIFPDQMNGLDFFFPAPAAAAAATSTSSYGGSASVDVGRNEEDDDWGDFVDSSVAVSRAGSLPPDPNGFVADRNGMGSSVVAQLDSAASRIESNQAHWMKPRGPVPLSVFGEAEEEEEGERDGSGASVSSSGLSFGSASSKHNNGNGSVNKVGNSNPSAGINDLIANLYRDNGQNKPKNGLNSMSEIKFDHFDTREKNSQRNSLNFNGNLSNFGSAEIPVTMGSSGLESKDTDMSRKGLDNLSWNPLNFDTQKFGPKIDMMNSSTSEVMFDPNGSNSGSVDQNDDIDEDDGWEFKSAESKSQPGDGDSKLGELKTAENGPAAVSNTSNLSWNFWSSPTNGIGPNVDSGKTDAVNSVSDPGNGEDDSWDDGGWEFKVAETGEPQIDMTSKVEGNDKKDGKSAEFAVAFQNGVHRVEDLFAMSSPQSGGWGLGFDFNPTSKAETTTFPNSSSQNQQYEKETVPSFFPSNSEETSWAFKQSSSETDTQNEEKLDVPDVFPADFQTHLSGSVVQEKEAQPEKPKGPLALSLFGEEDIESSDLVFHGDIPSSINDNFSRDKPKASGPSLSVNDLISSLYDQVEEKTIVNLSEKGDGKRKAVTDLNFVNDEADSWEFQGPTLSIPVSGAEKSVSDADDDSWESQGHMQTTTESSVVVDEFADDSWEFQGPLQPVTVSDLNSSLKSKGVSVGNETPSQTFASADTREQHENQVISIEQNDYCDIFDKLKTTLCYIALNHLENVKEARSLVADSSEGNDVEKRDEEIQEMQKKLDDDVLLSEVNLESLQPRPSDISEFVNTLKEQKFQALDSEYHLSERLLSAEKDWNSTIELLRHATLTLKILKLGSSEMQSDYISTWSTIASACAHELRHTASIWKQAQEMNVEREILSASQGKNYILALGEIFRVARILAASTRLYEPWTVLAPGSNILALVNECATLWSSSGLEDALRNISDLHNEKYAAQLLESIKHIEELDAFTLHSLVFSTREPTCHISGLPAEIIPGTKMVEWNGKHYFTGLANLWANLISRDPPQLPHALLGN